MTALPTFSSYMHEKSLSLSEDNFFFLMYALFFKPLSSHKLFLTDFGLSSRRVARGHVLISIPIISPCFSVVLGEWGREEGTAKQMSLQLQKLFLALQLI